MLPEIRYRAELHLLTRYRFHSSTCFHLAEEGSRKEGSPGRKSSEERFWESTTFLLPMQCHFLGMLSPRFVLISAGAKVQPLSWSPTFPAEIGWSNPPTLLQDWLGGGRREKQIGTDKVDLGICQPKKPRGGRGLIPQIPVFPCRDQHAPPAGQQHNPNPAATTTQTNTR